MLPSPHRSEPDTKPGKQLAQRGDAVRPKVRQPSSTDKVPFRQSLQIALYGAFYLLRNERNAQIQLAIAACVVVAGLVFQISPVEWAILWLLIGLVLALEALNTAIEAVVDLVTEEHHELAKIAKDVAAGAVVLMAISSLGVGITIFGPRVWKVIF